MNVDNIKKVITIAAKIGNVAGKSFEDGKVNLADLQYMPEFFSIFPAFIAVDWKMAIPEAKEISADEANELIAVFCSEFSIPQAKVEVTLEAVLTTVSKVAALVVDLMVIFKKPIV